MSTSVEDATSAIAGKKNNPSVECLTEDALDEPEEVWHSASDDPAPSHRRCVIHIDIDCFYAQVEMLERPELRDRPLGIQQKNIVVTSNYAARARGVGKCCLVAEALRACPELVLVNGSDLTRYRRMSARIHRLLTRFSRRVERLGFDENFLDVTEAATAAHAKKAVTLPGHVLGSTNSCSCGCAERLTAAAFLAGDVRQALRDELGISSCAGVGFNKLLSKLAGATHKPDQQTVVFPGGVDDLLLSAGAARALPGVGSRTAAQLADLGVRSVADLRRTTAAQLKPLGGPATVSALRSLAFGVDPAEVKPSSAALSIGVEDGFRRVDSVEECEVKIRELARRVLVLLAEDGRVPTVLKLSIRRYNREDYGRFRESRQTKVPSSLFARWRDKDVEVADRLVSEAMVLLKKMLKDEPFHLTLLGLAVTGFSEQSTAEKAGIAKFVQMATSSTVKRKSLSDSASDETPGGVDPAVWESLPPDIKSELLRDQELGPSKKRRQQSIANFFGNSARSATGPKGGVDMVTLDNDGDYAAVPAQETPGATSDNRVRSASSSPVEGHESCSDEQDSATVLSDSDPDDPGSPVISRSAVTRCEVRSGDSGGANVSGVMAEGEADDAHPGPTHPTAGDGRLSEVVPPVSRVACAVSVRDAQSVAAPTQRQPPAEAATVTGEPVPVGPSHNASPVSEGVSRPLAATGQETTPSPQSMNRIVDSSDAGTGAGGGNLTRNGAGAEDWDPDVFSQLPPDIQFELKMARRSERRGAPPADGAVSPRGQTTGAARTGTILRFFKR